MFTILIVLACIALVYAAYLGVTYVSVFSYTFIKEYRRLTA